MGGLFEYSAKRRWPVLLVMLALLIAATYAVGSAKRRLRPARPRRELEILTVYPNAAAEQVESEITHRIEAVLAGMPGITQIASTSRAGLSRIALTITPDTRDPGAVTGRIREAVSGLTDWPEGLPEPPRILEAGAPCNEVFKICITGDMAYDNLRTIAERLRAMATEIPGVARVDREGYRDREIRVQLAPRAMSRYGVSLLDAVTAVESLNASDIEASADSPAKSSTGPGSLETARRLAAIGVPASRRRAGLRLDEVALLKRLYAGQQQEVRVLGQSGIVLTVRRRDEADADRVAPAVRSLIERVSGAGSYERLLAGLPFENVAAQLGSTRLSGSRSPFSPAGIVAAIGRLTAGEGIGLAEFAIGPARIYLIGEQSPTARRRLRYMLLNGLLGLAAVFLTLTLFYDMRTALWSALSVVICCWGAFGAFLWAGGSLDTLSASAVFVMLGVILTVALAAAEHVFRRGRDYAPVRAAAQGTRDTVFAALVIVLLTACLPALLFLRAASEGHHLGHAPLTAGLALLITIPAAVFLLPATVAKGLARAAAKPGPKTTRWKVWESARRICGLVIGACLRIRYVMVAAACGLIAIAVYGGLPAYITGAFPIMPANPISYRLTVPLASETDDAPDLVSKTESVLQDLRKRRNVTYVDRIGRGEVAGTPEKGSLIVDLYPDWSNPRDSAFMIRELSDSMTGAVGAGGFLLQIERPASEAGQPVPLHVVGGQDEDRMASAAKLSEFLRGLKGVSDVFVRTVTERRRFTIHLDRQKVLSLGLDPAVVERAVRVALEGAIVAYIREGGNRTGVRVQLVEYARRNPDYLARLALTYRKGRPVPLGSVARIESDVVPSAYHHVAGKRATTVTFHVDRLESTPARVAARAGAFLAGDEASSLVYLEPHPEAIRQAEARFQLGVGSVVWLIAAFCLLVLLTRSLLTPLAIATASVVGLAGLTAVYAINGEALSQLHLLAAVGVFGVALGCAVLLANRFAIASRLNPGKATRSAMAEAVSDGLRPLAGAILAAAAGLLPMGLGLFGGDPEVAAIARFLIWGYVLVLPAALFLYPCILAVPHDVEKLMGRLVKRMSPKNGEEKPQHEEPLHSPPH